MSLQSSHYVLAFTRYYAPPSCPQCGDLQLAAARSEFVGEGQIHHSPIQHTLIHHTWACDACGHEFRTTVEMTRQAADQEAA